MGAGHSHTHSGGHSHGGASGNQRRLLLTAALAAVYMVTEFVAGMLTGSLALLADSGHMLSDVAALGLSVFAIWMARRPATSLRTYGFHRIEILAALANGAALLIIAAFILKEAWDRLASPPAVAGSAMMLVAVGGLAVNLLGLWILHGGRGHSLNVRGAYLHVMTDALGSIGAIAAGAAIWAFGWYWADPAISALIAMLVVWSSWGLIQQSVAVLMEGAPRGINVDQVRQVLSRVERVVEVHDLHVWSITSGLDSLSAHLVVARELGCAERDGVLMEARSVLHEHFGIDHVTIQVEPPSFEESPCAMRHK